ncbi:hypothetical protein U1Q18_030268 [Sarracenia purpurea var. burkii]
MAFDSVLSLSAIVFFLVLSHGCFAQLGQDQQQSSQQQVQSEGALGTQQHRFRARTDCRVQRIQAREPDQRIEAEAGITEIWDQNNNDELRCAGVAAIRHVLQPKGLLLPSYTNAPQIYYVVRGRAIQGTVISGCPETYESYPQSGGRERQRIRDRHQKVRQIREGDILAFPAGVARWVYNNGDSPLIVVSLLDLGNDANQLDLNIRKFFLAGNPPQDLQRRSQEREHQLRQEQNAGNVFSGFDEQTLADIFNIEPETARRLQGQDDRRGNIVKVERDFEVASPESEEEEEERERERRLNGLEETICTVRQRLNIDRATRADVFNPRAGRVTTFNAYSLPILNYIQLSAEKGFLYGNAILAPHWNVNAHSIIYVIRGSGRLQVVGNFGNTVFDGRVQEGQLIAVPQNFAVVKKASEEGLEWVAFKTNGAAVTSQLAGRVSAIRNMPEEVVMNSYDISREEARSLKYNREEITVFGPGSRSQRGGRAA